MIATRALTVVAEITGDVPTLARTLAVIHDDLEDNRVFRPGELPDTHFMRFVIVEDDTRELPPMLIWESNHDGKVDEYAIACARAAGPGFDRVFGACKDYPGASDPENFAAFVQQHAVRAEAFYCAYPGVPRAQVKNDRAIHDKVRKLIDDERETLIGLPPAEIRARIRAFLATQDVDTSVQGEGGVGRSLGKLAFYVAVGVILLTMWWLYLPMWFYLRHREKVDVPDPIDAPVHGDPKHIEEEDKIVQNQLTHIVDIKPGLFRYVVVRIVLTAIDVLARLWYVDGDLGGITTIHFARWVVLKDPRPNGRRHRLIFFSNYDGSWDAYLGEFIDRAAGGLTAVWQNTKGFPRASKLIDQGARDEEAFKQWARNHQILTNAWWSGVPDASVQNVLDDVWIRRRLGRELEEGELNEWLSRL